MKLSLILKIANSFAKTLPINVFNVKEHHLGFHRVTCPQPLNLPCACGTFRDPVSSTGSVGSVVNSKI